MKKHLFLLATILLVVSCSKSRVLVDVREIDFINKSHVTVKGTPVIAQWPIGIRDIAVCDSFLVVLSQERDAQLCVYSNDFELLGRFCYMGRADNEFLMQPRWFATQVLKGSNGNTLIPLLDGHWGVKVMDIQKSLESQGTVIVKQNDYSGTREFTIEDENAMTRMRAGIQYVFLDNDINHVFESYNYTMMDIVVNVEPSCAVMHDTAQIKNFKYLSYFDDNDFNYLLGSLDKHPDRNLVIKPLMYMDYILFFDLDNDRTFAIHQSGSLSFDDELPVVNEEMIIGSDGDVNIEEQPVCHFAESACSDSFFMIEYYAGDYSASASDSSNPAPELLFFDWEGNFLKSVKLDTPVGCITYDERKQVLYGIGGENDRIISFDLSSVVSDIAK